MQRSIDEALRTRCCQSNCGLPVTNDMVDQEPDQYPAGPGNYCVAKACMAWRAHADTDFREVDEPEMGFCGVAGYL